MFGGGGGGKGRIWGSNSRPSKFIDAVGRQVSVSHFFFGQVHNRILPKRTANVNFNNIRRIWNISIVNIVVVFYMHSHASKNDHTIYQGEIPSGLHVTHMLSIA
ncbi:hypothetical protein CCUS01_17436 [Colletotrichum cuscutae]|uniref:Uncharacterized protein n=1 Tax=Colletotrichum cuscutae TaxID=1209917 RepID=A0AAI9V9T7_9PEZI|nr:hypothetical protein CCUS01_17436 [Colletotrichum cuscutae]